MQAVAQILLALAIYGAVLSGLALADSALLQRIPFGVPLLSICLGAGAHMTCILVKKFPWILPSDVGVAFIRKAHKMIIVLAIAAPLIISWVSNETLYGALNPVGYWRDQAHKRNESGCEMLRESLFNSAEKYQVEVKKYDLGIATSAEVRAAIASVKLLSEMHGQCVQAENMRVSKAVARLKELDDASW